VAKQRTIRITAGLVKADAALNDSKTATAIWNALPISATTETWGDEIYFDIGHAIASESPKAVVELGDLGYWPPGRAFCIFFGPTPASRDGEIRPASPVNIFGRVVGDPTVFAKVRSGTTVRIDRASGVTAGVEGDIT
jgi:hypothetical protein